jgi:NAD(P) transhydrogenase
MFKPLLNRKRKRLVRFITQRWTRDPDIFECRYYCHHESPPNKAPSPQSSAPTTIGKPYSELTIGVPRETYPSERRVSLTPQNAALLLKKGFKRVLVESGAGHEARFTDEAYAKAGATLIPSRDELFAQSDVLLKVRPPSVEEEVEKIREGSTLISFLYPAQNKAIVEALQKKKTAAFAMDLIPRISRAQVFDALR